MFLFGFRDEPFCCCSERCSLLLCLRDGAVQPGFGVHTYKFMNHANKATYVKFHWKPTCGEESLLDEDAVIVGGTNHQHAQLDLFNAIEEGDYPEWIMYIQTMEIEEEDKVCALLSCSSLESWSLEATGGLTNDFFILFCLTHTESAGLGSPGCHQNLARGSVPSVGGRSHGPEPEPRDFLHRE